jgi:hypothetical protein
VEVVDHWEGEAEAHFRVVEEECLRLEAVEAGYQRIVARVH